MCNWPFSFWLILLKNDLFIVQTFDATWKKAPFSSLNGTLTQDQWSSEVQKSFWHLHHIFPTIDNINYFNLFQAGVQITRLLKNTVTTVGGQGRTRRQPYVDSPISSETKRVEISYHSHKAKAWYFLNVNFCVSAKEWLGHSGEYRNAAKLAGEMSKSVMQLISIHFWN